MPSVRKIPYQIAIALDQLCNALTGGYADETFSARCWRKRHSRFWNSTRRIVDLLFFFDPDHCRTSYESELARMHLPPAMRPDE